MFNFLNPSILYALAIGAIPILIHLINRKRKKEVPFSTVHFLKQMVRKEMRRLQLRQILLLIIRTFILLLIVLVFARPTMKVSSSILSGQSATEAVVIIDNSLSLNSLQITGNLLEKIRQRWLNLEEVFQQGDKISVLLGTIPIKIVTEHSNYSDDLWQKVVKEIQPSALKGNMADALIKALQILQESNIYNREIYLISDFQKTGFKETNFSLLQSESANLIKIFAVPVFQGDDQNVSVDSAYIVNRLIEKNQNLEIKARLRNQSSKKKTSSLLSLIIDSKRLSQQNIDLTEGELKTAKFEVNPRESGIISGLVESENDILLEDNRFYFNFQIPENIKILHLVPELDFKSYFPIILKPALDAGTFIYDKNSLNNWPAIDFYKYQVVILEGLNQIPTGLVGRLEQLSRLDYGLILVPGNNVLPSDYNRLINTFNLGQISGKSGSENQTTEYISLGKVNWEHPLFEGLFEEQNKLNPIEFFSFYQLKPGKKAEVIMNLKNNLPFLVESQLNLANVFLLTSPLQEQWTNLVYRGMVVPLVYRMLLYSAIKNNQYRTNIKTGETYQQTFRFLRPPFEFTLVKPSGIEEKISPEFKGSEIVLRVKDNYEPGNYRLKQNNEILGVYSVNHSPEESIQQYYNKSELEKIIPGLVWIPEQENLISQVTKTRFGLELWPYLLSAVFVLLLLEMLLAYTGSRKQKSEMEHEFA
jgi:hypothetical protein